MIKRYLILGVLVGLFSLNSLSAQEIDSVQKESILLFDIVKERKVDFLAIGDSKLCTHKNDKNCLLQFLNMQLKEHFYYPPMADYTGVSGVVYVQFVIDGDAKIKNVKVSKSSGETILDNAALKIVRSIAPLERSALLKGKPVATKYKLPVRFDSKHPKRIGFMRGDTIFCPPIWELSNKEHEYSGKDFQTEMFKFLGINFHYPAGLKQNNIQGKVYIEFTIDDEGNIVNVKIVKSSGYKELDNAGLKLVQKISKIAIPTLVNGKAVSSKYTVPISFKLN